MNYDENSYLKEQHSTFLTSTVHGKTLTIEVYNKLRAQLILRLKHQSLYDFEQLIVSLHC